MARDGKVELLRKLEIFSSCTDKELRSIAAITDEVREDAGSVLMREGAPGRELWVIAEGSVGVTRDGKHLATLGTGDAVGELALLDHGPRSATVTAESPVVAYVVDASRFTDLLKDAPEVGLKLLQRLAARLRQYEKPGAH